MKLKNILIALFVVGALVAAEFNSLSKFENQHTHLEMAKLALMGEFAVDSVQTSLVHGDSYTVVRVQEYPRGELQKLTLSAKVTKWLRENPRIDGFKEGFPVGTVPRPLPNHPNDVEFDVVVWRLEPVFTADGDVSYRAKHYATRVVTPKDHPLAQTPTTGAN